MWMCGTIIWYEWTKKKRTKDVRLIWYYNYRVSRVEILHSMMQSRYRTIFIHLWTRTIENNNWKLSLNETEKLIFLLLQICPFIFTPLTIACCRSKGSCLCFCFRFRFFSSVTWCVPSTTNTAQYNHHLALFRVSRIKKYMNNRNYDDS